jgi:hypothetical protein
MGTSELLAGTAEVDIRPQMGTQIAGDTGTRRPAEILIDHIWAKALALEDGQQRLCVLSMECLWLLILGGQLAPNCAGV